MPSLPPFSERNMPQYKFAKSDVSDINRQIGANLRHIRMAKNLQQVELADQVGVKSPSDS